MRSLSETSQKAEAGSTAVVTFRRAALDLSTYRVVGTPIARPPILPARRSGYRPQTVSLFDRTPIIALNFIPASCGPTVLCSCHSHPNHLFISIYLLPL